MSGLWRAAALAAGLALSAGAAVPQGTAAFRILNEERLLRDSRYGQAVLAELREAERRLDEENERIAEELAAEERALTEARAELSPEEFRARADAFDRRVEAIRAERNELGLDLARRSDAAAARFFDEALPIVLEMMTEQSLVAILRPDALIVGADWLDMTDQVIERLDAILGNRQPSPDMIREPPPEDD
jgi:Skp family chaperone for outer membrane proteins